MIMASAPFNLAEVEPMQFRNDELDHELRVRGSDFNLEDMFFLDKVRLFVERSRLEPDLRLLETMNLEEELNQLTIKVAELMKLYEEWKDELGVRSKRIPTLFLHVAGRLRRSMFIRADLYKSFRELAKQVMKIHPKCEEMYELQFPMLVFQPDGSETGSTSDLESRLKKLEIERKLKQEMRDEKCEFEEELRILRETSKSLIESKEKLKKVKAEGKKKREKPKKREKAKKKSDTESSSSDWTFSSDSSSKSDSNSSSEASSDAEARKSRKRHSKKKYHKKKWTNPVAKWKDCCYTKGDDLHDFLNDVEEEKNIQDVRDKDLLKGFSYLLKGAAKVWYRNVRDEIRSWKHLKTEMKAAFSANEDDDEILEKIAQLRQKEDETFAVFEARAEELFCRLNRPLEDAEKARKLLKGINLFYRSRIRSSEVRTLRALRRECRDIEEDKPQLLKLAKEERKREEKGRSFKVSSVQESEHKEREGLEAGAEGVDVSAALPNINPMAIQCYKCAKYGHYAHQCPDKVSCLGCGLENIPIERCPRCAMALAKGLWGNHLLSWMGGNPGQVVLPPMNVPPPTRTVAQPRMQTPQNLQNSRNPRTSSSPRAILTHQKQGGHDQRQTRDS